MSNRPTPAVLDPSRSASSVNGTRPVSGPSPTDELVAELIDQVASLTKRIESLENQPSRRARGEGPIHTAALAFLRSMPGVRFSGTSVYDNLIATGALPEDTERSAVNHRLSTLHRQGFVRAEKSHQRGMTYWFEAPVTKTGA